MRLLGVDAGATLTAATYCQILYSIHTKIAAIWHEEPSATTQERHRFFCLRGRKISVSRARLRSASSRLVIISHGHLPAEPCTGSAVAGEAGYLSMARRAVVAHPGETGRGIRGFDYPDCFATDAARSPGV